MSDDPLCAHCGHPRSNHPYRHPFVGPSWGDTITAQTARIMELEAKLAKAVKALSAIDQYGSDTLSGRADGPDDRSWQREGVLEMTRRARTTLAELKGQNNE